jgi:hypothetical protein
MAGLAGAAMRRIGREMRVIVKRGWRRKAGALVVALYALCLLAPVTAIAATDGSVPVHCLGEYGEAALHHDAGTSHQAPADHDHGQDEKCCGLFGVTALAPDFQVVAVRLTQSSTLTMPHAASLFGSRGQRIDRPPRDLQSF